MWLPELSLRQQMTNDVMPGHLVPMSSWSSTAWKLAKHDGFVAQSLLCLTLVILGVRTHDESVTMEASKQYQLVLTRLQNKIATLGQVGYSVDRDDHIASIAAAGFCCSQIEYILQSWYNGDRHLEGMASLLQACGPSCLENEVVRKIFSDHCVLWVSCSVTHRKQSLYSSWPWAEVVWDSLMAPNQSGYRITTTARQLPALLEEFDAALEVHQKAAMKVAVHGLMRFVSEMDDALLKAADRKIPQPSANAYLPMAARPADSGPSALSHIVASGYASAFIVHASTSAWEGIRLLSTDAGAQSGRSEDQIRRTCEQSLENLRLAVDRLTTGGNGLVTAAPLLFFLDSAWIGCTALSKNCGYNLEDVKPWFRKHGMQVTGLGYRPLQEPWGKV